jgi:hypothetical protein
VKKLKFLFKTLVIDNVAIEKVREFFHYRAIPAEINTPSGQLYEILKTICGFESTVPRITFGVLTRSDTLACSKESSSVMGQVGDFFRIFPRHCPTFHGVTFDRVAQYSRNMDHFKG